MSTIKRLLKRSLKSNGMHRERTTHGEGGNSLEVGEEGIGANRE